MPRHGQHQRQMLDRGVYDVDAFDAWMAGRGWSWRGLDAGAYGISVEEALVVYTLEDPVRWCETYLLESNGDPFRFFDYQKPSIRAWRQDVVHEDGAEVGKTREIMALLMWGHCTAFGGEIASPSSFVAAPQGIFLTEIIDAIERQVGVHKSLKSRSPLQVFWEEPRRTPHTQLRFRCINPAKPDHATLATIDFRPAGHDGEAFRGVHVTALALVDEAAKMKAKVQWTEFYRAMMPGCRMRAYSVPDGDRNTEFYRLCQEAREDLPAGEAGFRKFHWPKTVMPAPFWSEERDRHFVKLYGGRDTPGYQRNVLGLWGDAENPVFRWDQLLPNVCDLPDYRRVTLSADGRAGTLNAEVVRIELVMTPDEASGAARKSGREHVLVDAVHDLEPLVGSDDAMRRAAWADVLAPFLSHIDPRGSFWGGVDLGERNDPTEIVVSEQVGDVLRDVLRIKARGLSYSGQTELLFQVDRAFGHGAQWGADMGSAGTAVVKDLLTSDRYNAAGFDGRLTGFFFQQAVDCMGEDGEVLAQARDEDDDGNDRPVRAPAKHWATQCIVARLQGRGYALPYDSDVLNDYTSHTARQGAKWPIYLAKNDHTIDARRQQMLAKLASVEPADVDVFSVGAYRRSAA